MPAVVIFFLPQMFQKYSGVHWFVGLTVKGSKQDFLKQFINCIISYISGHLIEPLPFGNDLEDSLPITSWISEHFFN